MHFSTSQNELSLIINDLQDSIFLHFYLVNSKKSSNFAADFIPVLNYG